MGGWVGRSESRLRERGLHGWAGQEQGLFGLRSSITRVKAISHSASGVVIAIALRGWAPPKKR